MSDKRDRLNLRLPKGRYKIEVNKPSHKPQSREIVIERDETINIPKMEPYDIPNSLRLLLKEGRYEITFWKKGYVAEREDINLINNSTIEKRRLEKINKTTENSVRIVDTKGNPITVNITVHKADVFTGLYERTPVLSLTNASSYNIEVPLNGFYLMIINSTTQGYARVYKYFEAKSSKKVFDTITLRQNATSNKFNIITEPNSATVSIEVDGVKFEKKSFETPIHVVDKYSISSEGFSTFDISNISITDRLAKIDTNVKTGFDLYDIKHLKTKDGFDVTFICNVPEAVFNIEGPNGFYSNDKKLTNVKKGSYKISASAEGYDRVDIKFDVVDSDITVKVELPSKISNLIITTDPADAEVEIFGPNGFYSTAKENNNVKTGRYIVIVYKSKYDTLVDEFILEA